jgi:hypothetical protein
MKAMVAATPLTGVKLKVARLDSFSYQFSKHYDDLDVFSTKVDSNRK